MKDYYVKLSCGMVLRLPDFEDAGLSYVLCARLPNDEGELEDRPYFAFGSLWGRRSQVTLSSYGKRANAWNMAQWQNSEFPGVQLMTGKPTFRSDPNSPDGFAYLTDLDIEHRLIEKYPAVFEKILFLYREACEGTPCEIETKSSGRRLSAYVPVLDDKRFFRDTDGSMLFEIFSENGLSRLDGRYAILSGSVLDLPRVPREALQEIHGIISEVGVENVRTKSSVAIPATDENLPEGLTWKQGNKFLISTDRYDCTQSHASNPTCEYRKHDDGTVIKWCWACDTGWRVVEGQNRSRPTVEAPPIEVRERPSFRHFSKEERAVVDNILGISPDAGWHGQTPIFTTRYEYLHPLTQKFALNGQPSEVEKRRVWSTLFGNCEICGAVTAKWVDRYLLTAGRYCDGCHKDYHLGSYLELELVRKLPNSIVSNYQGFLGDDPEFADFRLWEPGTFTHLGAGMGTGKTTEIDKRMIELALQGLGKGIIVVPRISLARFLAHYLRGKHGYRSWGLWHEGVKRVDRFIGEYGAIVCLPSLPHALQSATLAGVKRLYIAIDEVDFAYNLLSISVEQATAVKKCLRDALHTTGLVVSGQTESTLALEAFAAELECENMQGFYNTAKEADSAVVLHKYPDVEGKSNAVLAGAMDEISDLLSAGHNIYIFCSSRRDGDVIAEQFSDAKPVLYNALTKGDRLADAVLKNQGLTGDSRLFIGTSAAGVGISIYDDKARTVIVSGLNYGSRDPNMLVQMAVRDRGRRGVSLHYTDYTFRLPIKPSENEDVSVYHEALKAAENNRVHVPEAGVKKIADAQALTSLANTQIEVLITHHLGTVGNMPVSYASALSIDVERIDLISSLRRDLLHTERDKKLSAAARILENLNLLTSREIRVKSNRGDLSPGLRLAHEAANGYARAVGWDDVVDRKLDNPFDGVLDAEDVNVAIALCAKNIDVDKLEKQRRGYLAVRFPKWTVHEFSNQLCHAELDRVSNGTGIEVSAVVDDRLLGRVLRSLLDRLSDELFDTASLAGALREVLTADQEGKTLLGELLRGALGASEYRYARFLAFADDASVVQWGREFVSRWYPANIKKRGEAYALRFTRHIELRLATFSRWLSHQESVPDGTHIKLNLCFTPTELPDPNAEEKEKVRKMRRAGETLKGIAMQLGISYEGVRLWCQDIPNPKPNSEKRIEAVRMASEGVEVSVIASQLNVHRTTVKRWLKY